MAPKRNLFHPSRLPVPVVEAPHIPLAQSQKTRETSIIPGQVNDKFIKAAPQLLDAASDRTPTKVALDVNKNVRLPKEALKEVANGAQKVIPSALSSLANLKSALMSAPNKKDFISKNNKVILSLPQKDQRDFVNFARNMLSGK